MVRRPVGEVLALSACALVAVGVACNSFGSEPSSVDAEEAGAVEAGGTD